MIPSVFDVEDGILLQFDLENGLLLGVQMDDEAADELVSILQNKLNARSLVKNPLRCPGCGANVDYAGFVKNSGKVYYCRACRWRGQL